MVKEDGRKLCPFPLFIVPLVAQAQQNLGRKPPGKQECGEPTKWEEDSCGN
jgi:hypothetical protein